MDPRVFCLLMSDLCAILQSSYQKSKLKRELWKQEMCQATFKGHSISLSDYFSAETLTLERKLSVNQEHWTQQNSPVDKTRKQHDQSGWRKFSRSGRIISIIKMYETTGSTRNSGAQKRKRINPFQYWKLPDHNKQRKKESKEDINIKLPERNHHENRNKSSQTTNHMENKQIDHMIQWKEVCLS